MAKKKAATADAAMYAQFEQDGKKYNVLRGAIVPKADGGIEKLTAADICVSPEAQQYLVENKCSCIEEVIE